MTWQAILAAFGVLLAAGAVVWYKLRTVSTDTTLAQADASQANKTADLAETQLAQKAQAEKGALDEQIKQIKTMADPQARQRAALELLHRFRGVH